MRIALIAAAALVVTLLTGCGQDPAPDESSPAAGDPTPSATPSPTPAGPTPVDPAAYATRVTQNGPGVDFDSPDHQITCGIWPERPDTGPYAGCRATAPTYETDPSTGFGGEIACAGAELAAALPAGPVCKSDVEFAGEYPRDGSVGVLPVGSSLALGGFTCTAPDDNTIECIREGDGAGFTLSDSSYRYF